MTSDDMTLDDLIELKKMLTKLTEITDRNLVHAQEKWYEDFDYTPRSTDAYERAMERTKANNVPYPVCEFLNSLPVDSHNRFLLRLYYINGASQVEISARLGIGQSTVHDRLIRLKTW